MKRTSGILAFALLVALPSVAQGVKSCDALKTDIAKKLDAKQVKSYTLEVVLKDQKTDAKVVGTCEGGTKKIVYRKDATPAPKATP
jgi:hypothetical protein